MGSAISSTANYGRQQFYFDPDVNLTEPPRHADCIMTNYELRQLLQNKVDDVSEKIQEVRYYTHPLNDWQMSKIFLHHAFIVLKTDNWFWSIEKDEGGITVQRSKQLENVRDKCHKQNRITGVMNNGIDLAKNSPGNDTTVIELFNHMWSKEYMNLNYHFLNDNCKKFADRIDEFVQSKSSPISNNGNFFSNAFAGFSWVEKAETAVDDI
jgi:hypothetical protein